MARREKSSPGGSATPTIDAEGNCGECGATLALPHTPRCKLGQEAARKKARAGSGATGTEGKQQDDENSVPVDSSSWVQPSRKQVRENVLLEDGRRLVAVWDPWQKEDFEALDDPAIQNAYLERPRGHDKTGQVGTEALIELIAGKPNMQLYCFAADEDQARLVFDDVVGKLVRGGYVQPGREPLQPGKVRILKNEVHSWQGSRLKVMAADVASAWGLRPDWVAADEVCEWRYEKLWQAIYSATGKRANARVLVISTAGWDQTHFAYTLREQARTELNWYFKSRGQCASWIKPEWLEQQRRMLPEHVFRRLHQNEWVSGVGAFLTIEEVDAIFSGLRPSGGQHALGLDVGLTHDRTVLADVRITADKVLVVDGLEVWQGRKGEKVELSEVEAAAYAASVKRSAPIWLDPFQAVQLGQNLKKRGRSVVEYTFSTESRRKLFALLLSAIRDRRLRCAPHAELRRELLGLEVQEQIGGGYRVDHKPNRFDDHVVGVALGVAGCLKREQSFHLPSYGFTKVGGAIQFFGGDPEPADTSYYETRCPGCGAPMTGSATEILTRIRWHWAHNDEYGTHRRTGPLPTTIEEVLRRAA